MIVMAVYLKRKINVLLVLNVVSQKNVFEILQTVSLCVDRHVKR